MTCPALIEECVGRWNHLKYGMASGGVLRDCTKNVSHLMLSPSEAEVERLIKRTGTRDIAGIAGQMGEHTFT